jgi:hypothetical protein
MCVAAINTGAPKIFLVLKLDTRRYKQRYKQRASHGGVGCPWAEISQ